MVKKQITALDHPPYSTDLVLCDFWLFSMLKAVMKQAHFSPLEEIKAFISRRNQGLSDKGAKETQRREFYQVLPWVAGLNAKVYRLGVKVL